MRRWWVGLGLGMACLASPAAAAGLGEGASAALRDARLHIMWFRADQVWSGALAAQRCGPREIEAAGDLSLSTPLRRAVFERRGELVAELRAAAPVTVVVLDTARACAARAVDAAPALLSGGAEPWGAFKSALDTCLASRGASGQVGSLTLWIDTTCNYS
jgi:hypothetical protein